MQEDLCWGSTGVTKNSICISSYVPKYLQNSSKCITNGLENIYQKIFKMYIEILSSVSLEFLAKSSKIRPKTSKKSRSSSLNFCISLMTRIYPNPKSAPPEATAFHTSVCWCIVYTRNHSKTSVRWCILETQNTCKKCVRWYILESRKQRRQLGIAVAGNMPTASFLTKMGKMQSAWCRLCRIAREARGERTDSLVAETQGHINSTGCEEIVTTVTAALHSIWRHLYDSMHAAQKPKSKLKSVTLDKESNMSTLWRREEFSKNLQQGQSSWEGAGYRGDNTCQKKSRATVQPQSRVFLLQLFLG